MKKNFFLKIMPILAIFAITCLIFFKIFLKDLYPIPGDLLVSFYFPWYSGGWEGYNPWTTHKELIGADSVRQIYPWKEFALNQIKKGEFPLWNPYTFSGQPLLANFQSSVFYPLTGFYFLTDPKNAWILLIVLQPFLGGIFMYLAIRSFSISKIPSLFGAVAFMLSSYLITWMENGNVTHSYIWLPLIIYSINKYHEKSKTRFALLMTISLSMAILAGHPQTTIYLYISALIYWLYKFKFSQGGLLRLALITISSFLLVAVQLVPTYHFYKLSPISLPFSTYAFDLGIMPFKNLITFFASDFFGHPANNNFWSQSYGDFTPYFGVIPLVFALWAIYKLRKYKFVIFATITSLFFILSAVNGPITYVIKVFRLPLIDSTTPSRFISISIFFLIILAAFGFEDLIKNFQNKGYLRRFLKFLIPIAGVYLLLWIFAISGQYFLQPKETWLINLAVTRRNLILPTGMFLAIPLGILILQRAQKLMKLKKEIFKYIYILGIFTMVLMGGIYYTNKFLPVAPKKFIFPDHPLFYWLKNNAGIDRFYGGGTAHIDFNFPTHYQVYAVEGYDTLRYSRYAELLASSFSGQVPETYLRSDAVVPNEENGYRRRLFDLLGVKYLLDKEDNPKTGLDWHYERFPNDKVSGFWQYDKFQVYLRETALPRIFMTTKYHVAKNDQEIINKIYDSNFNLETLILEQEPPIQITDLASEITVPKVLNYEPNKIVIDFESDYNSLLFISDTYDPDWQVTIDGRKTPLLRAHYALRGVAVPSGFHSVRFNYEPKSFKMGSAVSLASIGGLLIGSLIFWRKKEF